MKTKKMAIALAAVAVAALWFGRLAWRAHQNLVTLRAHNMPLAEVVRSLQRQTWENIRYDKSMNAKITLNVKDAPLAVVLDLVADRAGARWQKIFAVGGSGAAMASLESVLDGGTELQAAGWTNLAPRFAELEHSELEHPEISAALPGPAEAKPGQVERRVFRTINVGPDGKVKPGGAPAAAQTVTTLPGGKVDQWSSERLVLENSLLPLLGSGLPDEATVETAARVASSVHARSRLYYSLEKSPFESTGLMGQTLTATGKPGQEQVNFSDPAKQLTQWRRQARLRALSRSPEEQVERARQKGAAKMQVETIQEGN
jgi:hypothetical protein